MPKLLCEVDLPSFEYPVGLSLLEPSDAADFSRPLAQVEYAANQKQFVPHVMSEVYLNRKLHPDDDANLQIYRTAISSSIQPVLVAEVLVRDAHTAGLAGFGVGTLSQATEGVVDDRAMYIDQLAVLPNDQAKGIGALLMLGLLSFTGSDATVALSSLECNPAYKWYERLGFELASHQPEDLDMGRCYLDSEELLFIAPKVSAVRSALLEQKPYLEQTAEQLNRS